MAMAATTFPPPTCYNCSSSQRISAVLPTTDRGAAFPPSRKPWRMLAKTFYGDVVSSDYFARWVTVRKAAATVAMAPDEEKMTRRSPLDFPVEWERPSPGRRPDIFPQFSPMKTPLPPPLPTDPPEKEDDDDDEKKEDDPDKEDKPEE